MKDATLERLKHINECGSRARTITSVINLADSSEELKETLKERGFKYKKYECVLPVGARVWHVWQRVDEMLGMVDEVDCSTGVVRVRYTQTTWTDAIELVNHNARKILAGSIEG